MSKEKFRTWKFRGKLKVKYSIDKEKGLYNYFEKDQDELLKQIIEIVEYYMNEEIKLTNRQLYYQLVAKGFIPNAIEVYKRFCKFLTDARYSGLIDWDAIEDRGRTPEKHSEWENITGVIRSCVYSYRLPRWDDQDYYIELYCEKQAMESVLKPIADKYHIYFGFNKGYSSASTMYDLAQRIKDKIMEGKKTIIIYLGDHDPSGLDMVRDIKKRIGEFLTDSEENDLDEETIYKIDELFNVIPVALNMSQIKKYNCPPNPAKITDPRAKIYIEEYGNKSWELDALEPKVLMKIAEDGILKFCDLKKYNSWIQKEDEDKEALKEFGHNLINRRDKD